MDFLSAFYDWFKAFHLLSVISWMAALLYLPRLFVYHSGLKKGEEIIGEKFKIMEYRLARFIMTPAMIASWIFGLLLVMTPGVVEFGAFSWFYVKLLCVIAMSAAHGWLIARMKEFAAGTNTRSSKTYRIANEVPTVLMLVIVIMVVVKPF